MNAEELAQDHFRIAEEKDLVTIAEETIMKPKQCAGVPLIQKMGALAKAWV